MFLVLLGIALAAGVLAPSHGARATTVNFGYTGAVQSWTVPGGVNSITINAKGAGNAIDKGGSSTGTLAVTPGATYYINVGGTNGYNGGGSQAGVYHGSGMTWFSKANTFSLSTSGSVILVAGGAGAEDAASDNGGLGGGTTGGDAGYGNAKGGSQTAGGAGSTNNGISGGDGSFGQGGTSANGNCVGGGGGGWYGGGGGSTNASCTQWTPGAGGSGFVTSTLSNAATAQGVGAIGDGSLTIMYSAATAQVTSRSDTLNNSQPSATSNHSISFTTNNAIYGSSVSGSSTVKLAFPADFTMPSSLNCGDIDAATSTQFSFNYPACQPTATAWGVSVTNAISFVQSNASNTGASQYNSTSFNSPNTAGNLIVVTINSDNGTNVLSVTDTLGNVYTSAVGPIGPSVESQLFYAKNIKGGTNTVNAKINGVPTVFEVYVHEYSGADLVSPLDAVSASSALSGITTAMNSTTSITHFANELIFGFGQSGIVNSPGTGFTIRNTFDSNMSEDKMVSAAGAYNATETADPGSGWAMLMATFKTASAITLIPPTGTGELVAAGTPMTIKIGSNATYQQQGTHWITNPSTGGTYNISVGGTFGGSGNIPVAINAGQTVQATVAENLSFTVSPPTTVTKIGYATGNWVPSYTISVPNGIPQGHGVAVLSARGVGACTAGDMAVTDSAGNTYQQDTCSYDPSTNIELIVHSAYIGTAIAPGGTITFSPNGGSGYWESAAYNMASFASSNWVDRSATSLNAWGTSQSSGTTQPTTNSHDIVFASFGIYKQGPLSVTWPSGWGVLENGTNNLPVGWALFNGWQETANTGVQNVTVSNTPSGDSAGSIIAYKTAPGYTSCPADDGATVNTVAGTATSINFGTMSQSDTFYQGCQDLNVSTNAMGGYSLTAQESTLFQTADGKYSIPDTTCDAGNCTVVTATTWVTPTKYGLGHTCWNVSGSDCNASFLNGTKFKPVPNIAAGTITTPPTFVQANTSGNNGCNSLSWCQVTSTNVKANSTLLIFVSNTGAASINSITDSNGTVIGPYLTRNPGADLIWVYYVKAATAGTHGITVNYSGAFWNDLVVAEYKGADTVNPLDGAGCSASNINSPVSCSLTASIQNDLLVGYCQGSGEVCTADGFFNSRNLNDGAITEDKIATGTGSLTVSAGHTPNNAQAAIFGIALQPSSTGNSSTTFMSNTGPTVGSTGRAKYRLSHSPLQTAGSYSTVVTYTILGTF